MRIRIAHSPDSDDAFMFYGLASGKVPSNGYELEHVLSDIETLNRAALTGTYEITAVSMDGIRVAIPGELTTAYLALQLFRPDVETVVVPFDQIQGQVASGEVDAGL